jgi:spectinomycin phosphotransferase
VFWEKTMLEKPAIQDEAITGMLREAYGLNATQVIFLPLGADQHTAVYRAVSDESKQHFVKLRSGEFNGTTVSVPHHLHENGVPHIIPPLSTRQQELWVKLDGFTLAVYPFVDGKNGYETRLLDHHWISLGQTLKVIHNIELPAALADQIQRETYSSIWREKVRRFQTEVDQTRFDDPVAADFAALLKTKRREINHLVNRAERLGAVLQQQSLEFVLCHADIHAGNMLIDTQGKLHVIDWDTLIFAPKERDLMFPGGGLGAGWLTPEKEEALFYDGYGEVDIDPVALAYYRYERIVQDIAEYCEQILLNRAEDQDREEGLRQLTGQFLPDQVVDIALRSEKTLPPGLQADL